MLSGSPQCLFFIAPSWFPNVYLSCVLCTLCCQVLRSVNFWLPLRGSLTFIYHVCVLCTLCCQDLRSVYFVIAPSWFPNVYLSCVLCTLCCQVLRSVNFWLPLHGSLTFIYHVSCVPYVVRISAVFILLLPLRGSLTFIYPVYCVPYVVRFSAVFIFYCPFVVP
jgi:hypothetical protein